MKKLLLLSAFAAILAAGCTKNDDDYAYSHECGYITKSGTPCRRIVKEPGYCWQHK